MPKPTETSSTPRGLTAYRSSEELLSYAAGVIDGEGWIGLGRRTSGGKTGYHLGIQVAMTSSGPVELLHQLFGGNIRMFQPRIPHHKVQTVWALGTRLCVAECLAELDGRLIAKAELAQLALKYLAAVETYQRDPALREFYYNRFKELNK